MSNLALIIKETRVLIKELGLFVSAIIGIVGVGVFNQDIAMEYIYAYNIHLALTIVISAYINHFLSNKRHKHSELRLDEYQIQLSKVIHENSVGQLKAEVRQAFKDYHNIEVIDFVTTIKYLKGLDERRVALKVNSYTEDMMNILLSKIKL